MSEHKKKKARRCKSCNSLYDISVEDLKAHAKMCASAKASGLTLVSGIAIANEKSLQRMLGARQKFMRKHG